MGIESMADFTSDGTKRGAIETLKSVIKDIESGDIEPNKILVLSLNDANNQYFAHFHQGGMRMSECITLCETRYSTHLTKFLKIL